jgi:hemerythrin-like domain-containing protein
MYAIRPCRFGDAGTGYLRLPNVVGGEEPVVNDPIAILKRDHRAVATMLKELADSEPGTQRRKVTEQVSSALALHMQIEEQLIYPLVAERVGEEEELEAETEHTLARDGVVKMNELIDEPGFGAAVAMVTAGIKHHVKEEETELFPKLKDKLEHDDLAKIGDEVAAAKKSGGG